MTNTVPITVDPDSEPFSAGLEQGELRLQRCAGCQRFQFPPRGFCVGCHQGPLRWERASGAGKIYSLTVCYLAGTAEMSESTPFVVGLVELDEGVRILAPLELPVEAAEPAAIGTPVIARFRARDNRQELVFAPAGEEAADA
jgi:uncharacterized OB-fold protein